MFLNHMRKLPTIYFYYLKSSNDNFSTTHIEVPIISFVRLLINDQNIKISIDVLKINHSTFIFNIIKTKVIKFHVSR